MAPDGIPELAQSRDDERDVLAALAPTMSADRRSELAAEWRERADKLDLYAKACRVDGDTSEASDAEAAATDYRVAAEALEIGLSA